MDNNVQGPTNNNSTTFSVVALVCGILSIVACWIPYFNTIALILGIVGIVFGVKGRKSMPVGKTGMATAGFVLAIIGTAFSAIGFLSCTVCAVCIGSTATGLSSLY